MTPSPRVCWQALPLARAAKKTRGQLKRPRCFDGSAQSHAFPPEAIILQHSQDERRETRARAARKSIREYSLWNPSRTLNTNPSFSLPDCVSTTGTTAEPKYRRVPPGIGTPLSQERVRP